MPAGASSPVVRVLATLIGALLVAGAIGSAVVGSGGNGLPGAAGEQTTVPATTRPPTGPPAKTTVPTAKTTVPPAKTKGPTAKTTVPTAKTTVPAARNTVPTAKTTVPAARNTVPGTATAGAPPTSAALAEGLLDFADLGGFYDPESQDSALQIASSSCLAQLAPRGASSVAQTYFAGPDDGAVPAINEVVGGYDGSAARAAYAHDVGVLRRCTFLTVDVDGVTVIARLAAVAPTLPPGDIESAFSGTGTTAGRTLSVNVGVVQEAQLVVLVVYVDTVPPSNAIYGNFPSTVAAAAGKLA